MLYTHRVSSRGSQNSRSIIALLTRSLYSSCPYVSTNQYSDILLVAHPLVALVLHPYLKLDYIAESWGGRQEQEDEIAGGDRNAKNWREEAEKVVKATVRCNFYLRHSWLTYFRWSAIGRSHALKE